MATATTDPTAARRWDAVPLPAIAPEIPTRLTMLASCQRVVEWIAAPTKPAIPAGLATRRESSSEATTPPAAPRSRRRSRIPITKAASPSARCGLAIRAVIARTAPAVAGRRPRRQAYATASPRAESPSH